MLGMPRLEWRSDWKLLVAPQHEGATPVQPFEDPLERPPLQIVIEVDKDEVAAEDNGKHLRGPCEAHTLASKARRPRGIAFATGTVRRTVQTRGSAIPAEDLAECQPNTRRTEHARAHVDPRRWPRSGGVALGTGGRGPRLKGWKAYTAPPRGASDAPVPELRLRRPTLHPRVPATRCRATCPTRVGRGRSVRR